MKFLGGLNEMYDVVKTQILMMDPFLNIDKVFSLVIQQERRINPTEEETQNFINAVNSKKFIGKGRGRTKVCTFCGKTGHTEDICYKQYGYSNGGKGRGSSALNNVIGEGSDSHDENDKNTSRSVAEQQFIDCRAL
jgi:hypothetical protein